MEIKILKINLKYHDTQTNAFVFLPDAQGKINNSMAIFCHGYSSHKGSLLNWGTRLAEEGTPSCVFDLPGHFLGNFSKVRCFEEFQKTAHLLFLEAFNSLKEIFENNFPLQSSDFEEKDFKLILGGHSLGGLLALKTFEEEKLRSFNPLYIGVGLGLPPKGISHVFETPFYKSTLNVRSQLVCENLNPKSVLPWITKEKESLKINESRIHLICGKDDLVVQEEGVTRFVNMLENLGNNVTCDQPNQLPHHTPERAASFIKKFLKKSELI